MHIPAFAAAAPAVRAVSKPGLAPSCTPRRSFFGASTAVPRTSRAVAHKAGVRPAASASAPSPADKALILDCDGVIVESEELHRVSYNQCWAAEGLDFEWSVEFYEMLQNSIGGGKEKMRWYFDKYGWPDGGAPDVPSLLGEREAFIGHLHKVKTDMYRALIRDGMAKSRPGIHRLIDEAHARGLRTAICSAASGPAVRLVLDTLLGAERIARFDLILAGDDVKEKKPSPTIYNVARERLGVKLEDCVVIEDSQIGLQAGVSAGMKVVITYTEYTASQQFTGAHSTFPSLGEDDAPEGEKVTVDLLFPDLAGVPAARSA